MPKAAREHLRFTSTTPGKLKWRPYPVDPLRKGSAHVISELGTAVHTVKYQTHACCSLDQLHESLHGHRCEALGTEL